MRTALLAAAAVAFAGCMPQGLAKNQVEAKSGTRHVEWKATVGRSTFCQQCGAGPLVRIELGAPAKVIVSIPSCYAHAHQTLGDHDQLRVERADGTAAQEATLDIIDCDTHHVAATLHASWPDGVRVEANIDTELATATAV
jgi:hypothetical protein